VANEQNAPESRDYRTGYGQTAYIMRSLAKRIPLYSPNTLGYLILVGIRLKCKIHGVRLVCFCPACRGSARSESKARTSRRNGKLGGRPPKKGKRDAN